MPATVDPRSHRLAPPAQPGYGPAWAKGAAYAALLAVLIWGIHLVMEGSLDLMVYDMGAQWVAHPGSRTEPLYDLEFPVPWGGPDTLPFTYPPFAALLFAAFAWIPFDITRFLVFIADLLIAAATAGALMSYAHRKGRELPLVRYLGTAAAFALGMALIVFCGPWVRTISLGQVNILLFALIFFDLLRATDGTGSWAERKLAVVPRGVFIGIAAGIKLTPLAFGLIFLMQKRLWAIVNMALGFAATVAIGFIALFDDSIDFWTDAVSSSDRVGSIKYIDNTALTGVLIKTGVADSLVDPIRYLLVLLMMALVAVGIVLATRRGLTLTALSLNALLMLAMSPISWSHHQVYYPVVLVALYVEVFPRVLEGALSTLGQVMAWIWAVGAYIGPMRGLWIDDRFGVHLHDSETIWILPYVLLYLLVGLICGVLIHQARSGAASSSRPLLRARSR